MDPTKQALYIVLTIGFGVMAVLMALVLFRVFEILKDVKSMTSSARKVSKVGEVIATRIIGPVSSIIGAGAGMRKGAEVFAKRARKKSTKGKEEDNG